MKGTRKVILELVFESIEEIAMMRSLIYAELLEDNFELNDKYRQFLNDTLDLLR